MNYNDYNQSSKRRNYEWRCPISLLLVLLIVTVVATMLFTFHVTSQWVRKEEGKVITEQQKTIENLEQALENDSFSKLEYLKQLLDTYSYYSEQFDEEQMLEEVLRTYAAATGDHYAAYYTKEEYDAIYISIGAHADKKLGIEGDYEGIGHCAIGYAAEPAKDPVPRKADYVYYI